MPAGCLLMVGRFANGWVGATALVLFFAYVAVGWGYAIVASARAWAEVEDAFDGRDEDVEQFDEGTEETEEFRGVADADRSHR